MSKDTDTLTRQTFKDGAHDPLPHVFCRFRVDCGAIRFEDVNCTIADWTGCDAERFVLEGRNWLDQIHPRDRAVLLDVIEQDLAGGTFAVEYRVLIVPEAVRYVRHIGHRLVTGVWIGFIEDMTPFCKIRQDLERVTRRYEKMVTHVPGLVFEFQMRNTGELEFTFVSCCSFELIGVGEQDIYADSGLFFKAFRAQDRSLFYRKIAESAEQLTPLVWQGCHIRDGISRWFQCTARPENSADDRIVWDGLLVDITDQKQAEQHAEFLAQFPKENPNPVMRVNEEGRILYANLASYPLQKLWDRQTGQLLPQDLYEHVISVRQAGVPLTHEVRCKDHYYMIVFAPVHPGTDVNLYARDVTAVKIAELELRAANQVLIEHDQLKSEFVSTVTHELRTPLCIFHNILSNTLAGVHGPINKRLRENLNMAEQEVERLSRIISDFLDVSKIEAGSLQLDRSQCSLNDLLIETCHSMKLLAAAKKIKIHTVLPDTDLLAWVDRDRIVQVLVNLIGNAIKFIPIRGHITVGLKEDQDQFTVRIEDNGPGMTPEEMARIFDRFVQAKILKGPGEHGTGLGLTISRELVHLHGGRIWVESQVGRGSVFWFSIPKPPFGKACSASNLQSAKGDSAIPEI
jgi:signal transduction histidine kinase